MRVHQRAGRHGIEGQCAGGRGRDEVAIGVQNQIRIVGGEYADGSPLPAGPTAPLALMRPSSEFRVKAKGCPSAVGHTVIKPRSPCGTTVTLKE